jgi:branched-chain amino acid transport system ATP-binding protein
VSRTDDGATDGETGAASDATAAGATGSGTPTLRTEGLTKRFGGLTALDDVDLTVERGEIVGLIGPNGSGKTTLFNCVTGAYAPDEGDVYLRGERITGWSEHRIAREGLMRMFQQTRVYGGMTVRENLLVSARGESLFRPPSDATEARADELLAYVELEGLADVRAGRLSFGQQKLVEFAMALIAEPDVMLMDEPAGGINPSMIERLLDYIRDVNDDDVTIFLIEHDMDFVMEIADRIYVLAHGEKIAEGTPKEIQSDQRVLDAYLGRE